MNPICDHCQDNRATLLLTDVTNPRVNIPLCLACVDAAVLPRAEGPGTPLLRRVASAYGIKSTAPRKTAKKKSASYSNRTPIDLNTFPLTERKAFTKYVKLCVADEYSYSLRTSKTVHPEEVLGIDLAAYDDTPATVGWKFAWVMLDSVGEISSLEVQLRS